ncbi:MAG: hypothetical protein SFU83_05945 [Meiothermus sp.]|nr:hypothetical protein [Meiothermus sp.]
MRSKPINPVSLSVPHLLKRYGIENVIAPLETRTGQLWSALEGYEATLYPFVEGRSAMRAGMSPGQWLELAAAIDPGS